MYMLLRHTMRKKLTWGDSVLTCMKCRRDHGLIVYGYLGKRARVECPCGADFKAPAPFDQPWLLEQLERDSPALPQSVGPIPHPSYFD